MKKKIRKKLKKIKEHLSDIDKMLNLIDAKQQYDKFIGENNCCKSNVKYPQPPPSRILREGEDPREPKSIN